MSHVSFANVKTDVKTGSGDACVILFIFFAFPQRTEVKEKQEENVKAGGKWQIRGWRRRWKKAW